MKLEPNGVEKWAKDFESNAKKNQELSHVQLSVFVNCTINQDRINEDPDILKELESGQSFATVIWKRLNATSDKVRITPSLAIILDSITTNFGVSTMLCAYLLYKAHEHHLTTITIEDFSRYIFPFGIPTEEDWENA